MGKTLLITGASSDIGIELIRREAEHYDRIFAHYCHWSEQLEKLKDELDDNVTFLQADFLNVESIQELISHIREQKGEPDHIVHLPAPKIQIQKFSKTEWDLFERGWETSVRSLVMILQAFLPHMTKQKQGKVILMLTSCTLDMPPKYQTSYTTVKYALLGLLNSLAVEYGEKGITFNGVSPDMIQTKFLSEVPGLLVEQYAETRSQKRILTVDEVIPVFSFLLSDGADSITGMNVGVRL